MAKNNQQYQCTSCGSLSPKWSGKCFECNEWNTLEEYEDTSLKTRETKKVVGKSKKPLLLSQIKKDASLHVYPTGIDEVDSVLSGGIISDAVVLIGGEPGIGKSTLLLQMANFLGQSKKILYISGEESPSQVADRFHRISGVNLAKNLHILYEHNVDNIIATIESESPDCVIIDSIQTCFTDNAPGVQGSVGQVRYITEELTHKAKEKHFALLIIGHVTKDGNIAGPKTLEHIVDTVLFLEGERSSNLRILRSFKNRFGKVDQVGILEMTEKGLNSIKKLSEYLLAERNTEGYGSVLTCAVEGQRTFLVEVQALTTRTTFGYPKRNTDGILSNRLDQIIAVMQKYLGINLESFDVYVNVVGGFKIKDRSCDLAIVVAILSSIKKINIDPKLVVFGEIGLTGEVRSVPFLVKRIEEAFLIENVRVITSKNSNAKIIKCKHVGELESLINN